MRKLILPALLIVLLPASAFAVNNVGSCGWGTKLMDGNEGIAPQVLAVTTNGTSGNQTFGISSGTSGCTQNGVVQSNWKTAMFIDSNLNKLARDMSVGQGESLEALANLLQMDESVKPVFFKATQANFEQIFSSDNVSSRDVAASLRQVLEQNQSLNRYAHSI